MRIAIVEDDLEQAKLLEDWLKEAGYDCYVYSLGAAAIKAMQKESFDLILLDWLLPDINGDEVLSWIRENVDWRIPVIFTTQRDSEEDLAYALDKGADDYLIKPIKQIELKARIKALTRRVQGEQNKVQVLTYGPYRVDMKKHQISVNDEAVVLTQKEFELAAFLFRNAMRLLSRSHLLESVWGHGADINTRTLDTHISRLRKKLRFNNDTGWRLSAIYHHGYRLENDAEWFIGALF